MLADGRSGLVLCARYPTGFPVHVDEPWRVMTAVVDGETESSFRFRGGGTRTLRENQPVFVDRSPGPRSVKLVSGVSGPNTTIDFDLRSNEVVVVDLHAAITTLFGSYGPQIEVWRGLDDQVASSRAKSDRRP